ncbi:hypothetical protein N7509_000821 [Penicillium cosmopolitanum]|uniref:Mid2 domain-containing protein n=1 Tax=Penicillium cosmopolitanum TaxID=1131564 RepID=A0A9W9WBN5_9EURO|nr:uncharacterized protein N7509_000821 [Penicillium cosmopolitanum]KAJ5414194.1 hypothetical protein N7509_000821 [Penicillium cosmopolitanum]
MLAFSITRSRFNSIAFGLLLTRNLLPSWLHECMLVHKRWACGIHIRCYANCIRDGCGMLSKVCAERFLALRAEEIVQQELVLTIYSGFKCTHLTSKDVCNGIGCTSIATDGDSSLQKFVSIARSTEYNARLCITGAITPAERTLPGNVTVTTTYPTKSTILVTVRIAENDDSTSTIVSTLVKGPYITSTQMTASIPSISIFAPLIQLVHQPSDLSNGTSIITTGVETITAMQDSHSSSSLSTGAKAGIGVASAVLALALIGAAFFFLSRKRSRIKLPEPVGESSYANPHDGAYELASSGQKVELPASNETGTIIGTNQPEQESDSIFELPG